MLEWIKKSVQVDNTDAEGRLILADAITLACSRYKNIDQIITIATLTGSITISLGKYMAGLFANDTKLGNEFKIKSDLIGDEVWILPIHRKNIEAIKSSELADYTNNPRESKYGSSSIAAAFLNEFVEWNIKFIHIDIAGVAVENNRATGHMVKGIINYLNK